MDADSTVTGEKLLLVGCGILRKEIALLIRKNDWRLETDLAESTLHVDFECLERALRASLHRASEKKQQTIVFYGSCHPLMDSILRQAGTIRTPGQNCVEILLGPERFREELAQGAFFLLEDWALRWNAVATATFGPNREIMREIFQGDRRYILALRTPCSGDFHAQAEEAARQAGLPLRWMDVGLDHLEKTLQEVIDRKMQERQCPK